MTTNLSRRSALTVIGGAAAAAVPASVAAAAGVAPDAELGRLWLRYQALQRSLDAAKETHRPFREAADAEIDKLGRGLPLDIWSAAVNKLYAEPNFCRTWRPVQIAWDDLAPVIRSVHRTEAQTLFGVGVKLAALPDTGEDFSDAAISVMRDIDRLLGTDFAARYAGEYTTVLADWGLAVENNEG
jgi:hypothetical protein